MPTVKGRDGVKRFFAKAPEEIERKLIRGAARAGATVIADEAKLLARSEAVRDGIKITARKVDDTIRVTITVETGWARAVGTWLEYGTKGHFISISEDQREGKSVRRINELQRQGSLVIGGQFVGATVWHPGAEPHPFLRPAFDIKIGEAITTAQSYIDGRVTPAGITGVAEELDQS